MRDFFTLEHMFSKAYRDNFQASIFVITIPWTRSLSISFRFSSKTSKVLGPENEVLCSSWYTLFADVV